MEYEVNCPCCNNKIKIQIGDDGEISVISLIETKSVFKDLDFGVLNIDCEKGGDNNG